MTILAAPPLRWLRMGQSLTTRCARCRRPSVWWLIERCLEGRTLLQLCQTHYDAR